MKKLISMLVVTCFLLPFFCFADSIPNMQSINGFRGIRWGTLKKDIDKEIKWVYQEAVDSSAGPDHPIWHYWRKGDNDKIGMAKVDIYYGFWLKSRDEEIFCRVNIVCKGEENWNNLLRALCETFGSNYNNMEYTRISSKWHPSMWSNAWGEVWLISKEVEKQIDDFVKGEAKKGKKDIF